MDFQKPAPIERRLCKGCGDPIDEGVLCRICENPPKAPPMRVEPLPMLLLGLSIAFIAFGVLGCVFLTVVIERFR